jgi:hypothetical protein
LFFPNLASRLLAASLLWLLGGVALLMTTLVPLHTRTARLVAGCCGWSWRHCLSCWCWNRRCRASWLRCVVNVRRAHRTIWH